MASWFAFHSVHRLNRHKARSQAHGFHCWTSPPRARCLTFALAANAAGPRRRRGFTNAAVSGALTTRARVHPSPRPNGSVAIHPFRFTNARRARVRHQTMAAVAEWICRLVAALLDLPPGLSEPPLALRSRAHCAPSIGTLRPAPGAGLDSFPAAALADAMAAPTPPGSRSFRNRKLPRPALKPTVRARANAEQPEAARLRPARTTAISPIATGFPVGKPLAIGARNG